ncbi:MAG TPA: AI-2E family transporter [Acidisarcina sp.]
MSALTPTSAATTNSSITTSQPVIEAATAEKGRTRRGDVVFTIAVLLSLALAWLIRDVLLLLYVTALFAVVLMPLVRSITRLRIGRLRISRVWAVMLLLISAVAFLTLFFWFALPPVARDLRQLSQELPSRGPQLLMRVKRLPFTQHIDTGQLNTRLQGFASTSATYIFMSLSNWASKLFDLITGIILTVYFLLEGEHAYAWVLSLFPLAPRERLDKTLAIAEVRMGKWLIGQASLMAILGVLSTVVFVALHIRYAYALGVLMGLFNLIPIVGAMISMALVLLVAAIDSWGRVVGAMIFYAIYAQVETSYLTPRIMKSSVDLPGLAIIVALLLGSAIAGVVGAMVSVPTAVLVAVLVNEYLVKAPAPTPEATAAAHEATAEHKAAKIEAEPI